MGSDRPQITRSHTAEYQIGLGLGKEFSSGLTFIALSRVTSQRSLFHREVGLGTGEEAGW
jgi:hypothetical protein